jgi:predicted KAP-like P-loop ATPase
MYSDDPILDASQDELGISAVVKRLAKAILEWPPEKGLVVGLYGQWGQGKTSTLNLLAEALHKGNDKCKGLVVRFNPWYCSSESTVLLSFFGTMAQAIGSTELLGPIARRRLSSMFKGLGKVAGSLGSTLPGGSVAAAGVDAALAAVSDLLSDGQIKLEKERDKLAKKLKSVGSQSPALRAVVLIDDLDRVSDPEIALILKLVRLVASLPNVTYILSADDQRIRQAISREVAGEYASSFLEKIVQVAVHLPPLSSSQLENLVKEGLAKVAEESRIANPHDLFVAEKHRGLDFYPHTIGRRVRTLRDRARLLNSMRFLLLSGETRLDVHPHDAILIAFLLTFYPDVYRRVARNRAFLTGDSTVEERVSASLASRGREAELIKAREETFFQIVSGVRNKEKAEELKRALEVSGMTDDDIATVTSVLDLLFPNAKQGFSYDDEAYRQERLENRIRNADRFDRYFTLEAPSTEIADEYVEQFLEELGSAITLESTEKEAAVSELFGRLGDLPSESHRSSFTTKFRDRLALLPRDALVGAAEAVLGAQQFFGDSTSSLLFQVVRKALAIGVLNEPGSEQVAASIVVREAQLLRDVGDGISTAKAYVVDKVPGVRLGDEAKQQIARAGLSRMVELVQAGENVFDGRAPVDAMVILWRWRDLLVWLKEDTLPIQVYTRKLLAREPASLVKLLYGMSAAGDDGKPRFALGAQRSEVVDALDSVVGTEHVVRVAKELLDGEAGSKVDPDAMEVVKQAVEFLSRQPDGSPKT